MEPRGEEQGPRQDIKSVGADFHIYSKKLKVESIFEQRLRVKYQISSTLVGAKSVFLKICGCSCTHCTHTNKVPDS